MEFIDGVIDAMTELVIENMTMRKLLTGKIDDLNEVLRSAKADPDKQRLVREKLSVLRTGIGDEVAIERMMQSIVQKSLDDGKAN